MPATGKAIRQESGKKERPAMRRPQDMEDEWLNSDVPYLLGQASAVTAVTPMAAGPQRMNQAKRTASSAGLMLAVLALDALNANARRALFDEIQHPGGAP